MITRVGEVFLAIRREYRPRWVVALLLAVSPLLIAGCGAAAESQQGATLRVYVSLPLSGVEASAGNAAMREVEGVLTRTRGRAGPWRVRVVHMDDSGVEGNWTLARVGANARRASEDSAAIGYIGDLDPRATRFSLPITDEAQLPRIGYRPEDGASAAAFGREAMRLLLAAIREAGGDGADRAAVGDRLAELIVRDGEPPGLSVELPGD